MYVEIVPETVKNTINGLNIHYSYVWDQTVLDFYKEVVVVGFINICVVQSSKKMVEGQLMCHKYEDVVISLGV